MERKAKTPKILLIVSLLIAFLGILSWYGTEFLIDKTDSIIFLLSLFTSTALKLLIVIITVGVIALLWLIYGLILLYGKIKRGDLKWKNFKVIGVLTVIFVIITSTIFLLITARNDKVNTENQHYTIITDSKYKTMQNDGGSNWNIYYEVDLGDKCIEKYADHYVGFKGYEYRGKLIYKKDIDGDLKNEFEKLLIDLFAKEDIRSPNNYSPYEIATNNDRKDIYNGESIKLLQSLLDKIDKMS